MNDSEDHKIASRLVEAAGKYSAVVDAESFDLEEYRKAELALHEAAIYYGRRLRILRESD